jgi:hypothetical protein
MRRIQTRFTKAPHKSNPGGHEEVRASIPAAIFWFLHKFTNLWTSLTRKPKGRGKPREGRSKMKEVREMGAPSSYLTGLLHNPSFAPRYFVSNHLTRGCYGPT